MMGGKVERAGCSPSWGVFGFKVAEPKKARCRAIFACDLNKVWLKAPRYTLKGKEGVRKCCYRKGRDFLWVQFDFVSFYDHFVLDPGVRKFFWSAGSRRDGTLV